MNHNTVFDEDFEILESDKEYNYQLYLTAKLNNDTSDLDQNRLNEIVLWKLNRYAPFDKDLIEVLNSISQSTNEIDFENTKNVLRKLLNTRGVRIAMASTILRFRNPKIYQIIDQRVYRVIYKDKVLISNSYVSTASIEKDIEIYIKYLEDLRSVCKHLKIDFEEADRLLYMADRRINSEYKLSNFS